MRDQTLTPAEIGPEEYAAYETFSRSDWARLRSNTPLTLSEEDLRQLRGVNDEV